MEIKRTATSPFYQYDFYFAHKRHRGSTGETEKAAALRFLRALKATVTGVCEGAPRIVTVGDLLNQFEPYVKSSRNLRPSPVRYYLNGMKVLRESTIVRSSAIHLNAPTVSCCRIGNSPANTNAGLRTLSAALSFGRKIGALNTSFEIKLVRTPMRHRVFSLDEERRLLACARQPLKDVFVLMRNTGARPSEIFSLRWRDIDLAAGMLFIATGKTEKARRFIALTSEAKEILVSRKPRTRSEWVFPSKKLKKGCLTTVAKQFAQAREAAGLPKDLLLYTCRHSYATRLMELSGDTTLVSAQLGHSSSVQSERYIHPRTARAAELMEQQRLEPRPSAGV